MFTGLSIYLQPITYFIGSVLVPLLLTVAFFAFGYGIFLTFIAGGADDEKRKEGKQLALYAVIGFVLIISVFGVVNLLAGAIGLSQPPGENLDTIPSVQ